MNQHAENTVAAYRNRRLFTGGFDASEKTAAVAPQLETEAPVADEIEAEPEAGKRGGIKFPAMGGVSSSPRFNADDLSRAASQMMENRYGHNRPAPVSQRDEILGRNKAK
jgi:hypothetical protein